LSEIKDLFPIKILEATLSGYDKAYSTQRFMNFIDTTPGWLEYTSANLKVKAYTNTDRNTVDGENSIRKGIELWRTPSAITDYADPAVWDWIHLKLKEYAIAEGMGSSTKFDGSATTSDDDVLYGWAEAGGPISGPDVISFWCTIGYHNSELLTHHHAHGQVGTGGYSGVFYVDAVPEQGSFIFEHPIDQFVSSRYAQGWGHPHEHSLHPPIRIGFNPADGKLLLFPSYLKHYVTRNITHAPRLTISFDAIFSYK
jgi:hypothetical protein